MLRLEHLFRKLEALLYSHILGRLLRYRILFQTDLLTRRILCTHYDGSQHGEHDVQSRLLVENFKSSFPNPASLILPRSQITLGTAPPHLQFEGGNVIIRLGESLDDHLIIHESVLAGASDRFRTRFASAFCGGRDVVETHTGERCTTYEYHLTYVDQTFILTDEVSTCPVTASVSLTLSSG